VINNLCGMCKYLLKFRKMLVLNSLIASSAQEIDGEIHSYYYTLHFKDVDTSLLGLRYNLLSLLRNDKNADDYCFKQMHKKDRTIVSCSYS
jgi:hypothetical protein